LLRSEASTTDPDDIRYTISAEGDDAMIQFGEYDGVPISEIYRHDKAYFNHLCLAIHDSDFQDVVSIVKSRLVNIL